MSVYTKAANPREVYLIAAGVARGNRLALMRAAEREQGQLMRSTLVKAARDFNRDVVSNLLRAKEYQS